MLTSDEATIARLANDPAAPEKKNNYLLADLHCDVGLAAFHAGLRRDDFLFADNRSFAHGFNFVRTICPNCHRLLIGRFSKYPLFTLPIGATPHECVGCGYAFEEEPPGPADRVLAALACAGAILAFFGLLYFLGTAKSAAKEYGMSVRSYVASDGYRLHGGRASQNGLNF